MTPRAIVNWLSCETSWRFPAW